MMMKLVNGLPYLLQVAIARSKLLAILTGMKWWGLENLDKKLVAAIGHHKNGFFVELVQMMGSPSVIRNIWKCFKVGVGFWLNLTQETSTSLKT